MTAVGIRELKTSVSELLRQVREQGEVIDITYYGEVVARLVPVKQTKTTDQELTILWEQMDQLAQQVAAKWSGSQNAVTAVRETRREL